ncbi:N-formylglutamate amidohydrolase [Tateyamaria omphalii]|uniref:N-formylglutamate amidohydrolase n=1 Tax=Tateyamaria omphalii TaxID=299262 RepID=UPI00167727A8|nr:N-formylglutamate amidohydrolase [Tateyamaria omphalii]GGX51164.1 N-formylglutamate amidohydrolase [Tateyamaria omphalii]
MAHSNQIENVVQITRGDAASPVVLVCEHASHLIPDEFDNLGLPEAAKRSHIAWDPGAHEVASHMSQHLQAVLVESKISRLVYDCNRPPEAPDAMPARSEAFAIPGNEGLTKQDRAQRAQAFYDPFRRSLATQINARKCPVIITIHSFTPVYNGTVRDVEIGILQDDDGRLADAFLNAAPRHTDLRVQRNAPYGPEHGVTHTLKTHAVPQRHLNVMIEIRNDLIATESAQLEMATLFSRWAVDALATLGVSLEHTSCKV